MQTVFAIATGSALGGLLRHFLNSGASKVLGNDFPWGIFIVNVLGSLAMGVLAGLFAQEESTSPTLRAFLAVGVLGGFTTFSTFSLDAVLLMQRGALVPAALYIGGSVVLAIAGVYTGMALMRAISA